MPALENLVLIYSLNKMKKSRLLFTRHLFIPLTNWNYVQMFSCQQPLHILHGDANSQSGCDEDSEASGQKRYGIRCSETLRLDIR